MHVLRLALIVVRLHVVEKHTRTHARTHAHTHTHTDACTDTRALARTPTHA